MNIEKDIKKAGGLGNLLANKSWCKAVWLEMPVLECCEQRETCPKWHKCSRITFQILQQQGEKEAISYILKTMI